MRDGVYPDDLRQKLELVSLQLRQYVTERAGRLVGTLGKLHQPALRGPALNGQGWVVLEQSNGTVTPQIIPAFSLHGAGASLVQSEWARGG